MSIIRSIDEDRLSASENETPPIGPDATRLLAPRFGNIQALSKYRTTEQPRMSIIRGLLFQMIDDKDRFGALVVFQPSENETPPIRSDAKRRLRRVSAISSLVKMPHH